MKAFHERIVDRFYGHPIIDNVWRGAYVEAMIEDALQKRDRDWKLVHPWAAWDIEHGRIRARIEVKQSAILQPSPARLPQDPSIRKFDIPPRTSYRDYERDEEVHVPLQRVADIYVFAWHPVKDEAKADHRRTDQWDFYVVPERRLPQEPITKSIGFGPLSRLLEPCSYDVLAERVLTTLAGLDSLKADTAKVG